MRDYGVNALRDYFKQRASRRDARRLIRDRQKWADDRQKFDAQARRLGYVLVKRDTYLKLQRQLFTLRDQNARQSVIIRSLSEVNQPGSFDAERNGRWKDCMGEVGSEDRTEEQD